jgi:hypothetical protein
MTALRWITEDAVLVSSSIEPSGGIADLDFGAGLEAGARAAEEWDLRSSPTLAAPLLIKTNV